MYTAPSFGSQRHYGRTFYTGQCFCDFFQTVVGYIHQNVFLVFSSFYGTDSEEQFLENFFLFFAQGFIPNEQGFALHYRFYFFKIIAYQSRTGTDDVENSIGQMNARCNLYRTGDEVDIGFDLLFVEVLLEDIWVGSGNFLSVEPLYSVVFYFLRNG